METINKPYFIFACLLSFLIHKKRIAYFSSFYGQYNDNPRQISEKLHEIAPEIPIYWVKSTRNHVSFPKYVHTIDITSFKHYLYMFIAKVTVDNQIGMKTIYLRKTLIGRIFTRLLHLASRNQLNIGTWHGTPLKNIGEICIGYNRVGMRADTTNYSVSGCDLTYNGLSAAFPKAFEIKRYGTPRNDVFFRPQEIDAIKRKIDLPLSKKVLLFAPTFREDIKMSGISQIETINWGKIITILSEKFGGEWVVAVRIHPHVMEHMQLRYNSTLVNGNVGDDMADYLLTSDALLTDYSSSFFDYALTQRPIFLYTPDFEQYKECERGFYFDFTKLPFPISYTPDQLIESINRFDKKKYTDDVKLFLQFIGDYEEGKASERIVKDVLNFLK